MEGNTVSAAIGITGGTGTGKSTVASVFAELGARILDADKIGHTILKDGEARSELIEAFGAEILGPDGQISRSHLGGVVFSDHDALGRLNAIVHPRLLNLMRQRMDALRSNPKVLAVVVDAALITEWKIEEWFDAVVIVDAPDSEVQSRLRGKGLTDEQIRRRIASQLSTQDRVEGAQVRSGKPPHILMNDGSTENVRSQAEAIWKQLVTEA
jgi:dephospho-CoA kinase